MQEIATTKHYRHLKVGYFRKRHEDQNPATLQRTCGVELKRRLAGASRVYYPLSGQGGG